MRMLGGFLVTLACCGALPAQESASYRVERSRFDPGGPPSGITALVSPSYRISLSSAGGPLGSGIVTGPGYTVAGGFVAAHAPPGEIPALWFEDRETLAWHPGNALGGYNLYRGLVATIDGVDYGECAQQGLTAPTAATTEPLPPGSAFFYLVTALNPLGEEGPRGFQSSGAPRPGVPCP